VKRSVVSFIDFFNASCKLSLFAVAPHIDRKNLQKKIMRSGQTLKMEADVKGEPAPVVTWKLKNDVLKTNDKFKIDNEDYKTSFSIIKIKRADAGTYTVIAKNDSGTDQVDIDVEVLGEYNTITMKAILKLDVPVSVAHF